MAGGLICVEERVERLAICELLEYCEHLSGTTFDHAFMSAGEALTTVLAEFDLAKDTGAGFTGFLTGEKREVFLSATALKDLPCLEDLVHVSLGMAHQYDRSPTRSDDWKVFAELSSTLVAPLRKLGLIDAGGVWTEASIPIQIRFGSLNVDGETGNPQAIAFIESYARMSLDGMPQSVCKALDVLHSFSPSYERFECERVFGNAWRFGTWVNGDQTSRCASLGSDAMVHQVVDQILIDRHNS